MKILNKMQENIISQNIKTSGIVFELYKRFVDRYGTETYATEPIKIKGLYHEERSYIEKSENDTTIRLQKFNSCVLINYKVLEGIPEIIGENEIVKKIDTDDKIILNGKEFKVNDFRNYYNSNLIYDIYMEEVI